MKNNSLLLTAVVSFLAVNSLFAQETTKLEVNRIAIAKDIVEREPVDTGTTFSNEIPKLFCFTHITGANNEMTVTHRWVYNDTLTWEVKLPVQSASWRTYSSKNFIQQWTGEWTVVILDESGDELARTKFELTKSAGN